ncbi:prepilin-type N-terminal cleavage/methylation domain-containing protein [Tsuneonella sp. HG222]
MTGFRPSGRAVRRRGKRGEEGMTLIEILVVLAIIAVASAVAVLAVGDDHGMSGLAEAKRIAGRVQFASDRTLTGEGPLALVLDEGGYTFVERDENGTWSVADDLAFEGEATIRDGFSLQPQGGEGPFMLGADYGGQPFTLILSDGQRNWAIAYDGMTASASPAAGRGT